MTVAQQPIGEFLDAVASGRVTPSGGAVAAVGGAAGAALCEMVCIHSIDAAGSSELAAARENLETNRQRLLDLADGDARVVDRMQSAFATHGRHASETQRALEAATEVPLEIAETSLDVLDHAEGVVTEGSDRAAADAVTGTLLAHAALRSAVGTVRANLELVEDDAYVSERSARVEELDAAGNRALDRALGAGPSWCRTGDRS